jgi:GT2 family glycosyltransferase
MMLLSVIIPNWNGLRFLPTCLASLFRQDYPTYEVIIVDNASTDNSRAWTAEHYPAVRWVQLSQNTGFTGACNAGFHVARGEIQILLNNDTESAESWLSEIAAAFTRHPQAGIVASKMLLFDQRDIFHNAGDVFYEDGTPGNRGVWQKDVGQYGEEQVFSACGGAAAYRAELLQAIGWLDDDFFFSCEDVDLAWRAQLRGWEVWYAPQAAVFHQLSATGGGVTASFHDGRNQIYLLVKDLPLGVWRVHGWKILHRQFSLAWEALLAWRGKEARARLRGQWAGLMAMPRLLGKRRAVQATRSVSDVQILQKLTRRG